MIDTPSKKEGYCPRFRMPSSPKPKHRRDQVNSCRYQLLNNDKVTDKNLAGYQIAATKETK
jgi:hypothetical protein